MHKKAWRVEGPCLELGLRPPPWKVRIFPRDDRLLVETLPGRVDAVRRWLSPFADVAPPIRIGARTTTGVWRQPPQPLADLWNGFEPHGLWIDPCGAASFLGYASEDVAHQVTEPVGLRLRGAASSALSTAQQDALELAVALGYYEIPRRIDLRTIAARMGISHGAVSELLRRAEQHVLVGHCDQRIGLPIGMQNDPGLRASRDHVVENRF